jgi:hypothetical protein
MLAHEQRDLAKDVPARDDGRGGPGRLRLFGNLDGTLHVGGGRPRDLADGTAGGRVNFGKRPAVARSRVLTAEMIRDDGWNGPEVASAGW